MDAATLTLSVDFPIPAVLWGLVLYAWDAQCPRLHIDFMHQRCSGRDTRLGAFPNPPRIRYLRSGGENPHLRQVDSLAPLSPRLPISVPVSLRGHCGSLLALMGHVVAGFWLVDSEYGGKTQPKVGSVWDGMFGNPASGVGCVGVRRDGKGLEEGGGGRGGMGWGVGEFRVLR